MSTNNNLGFQILRSIRVAVKSSLNVFKGITGLREMLGLDATMNKQRQRVVHILPYTRDRPFDRIFLQNGFKNIERQNIVRTRRPLWHCSMIL